MSDSFDLIVIGGGAADFIAGRARHADVPRGEILGDLYKYAAYDALGQRDAMPNLRTP